MSMSFELVGLIIVSIWLLILTILFWQLFSHYNILTRGSTNKSLKAILEEMLRQFATTQKDVDHLKMWCATIEKDGQLHIQKIGLLRFNPFKDTGGDQSFILTLIDGHDTGVVISGLYSRSGTRWYAKQVKEGKGVEHELSDEEKKAIKSAKQL